MSLQTGWVQWFKSGSMDPFVGQKADTSIGDGAPLLDCTLNGVSFPSWGESDYPATRCQVMAVGGAMPIPEINGATAYKLYSISLEFESRDDSDADLEDYSVDDEKIPTVALIRTEATDTTTGQKSHARTIVLRGYYQWSPNTVTFFAQAVWREIHEIPGREGSGRPGKGTTFDGKKADDVARLCNSDGVAYKG